MNQETTATTHSGEPFYDRFDNFNLAKSISEKAVKNRVAFPSGQRAKIVNPNAKPLVLSPPK